MQLNLKNKDMSQVIDCPLPKILIKISVVNIAKIVLIMLNISATDAFRNASKRAIQKTAEATGDYVGEKTVIKLIKLQVS